MQRTSTLLILLFTLGLTACDDHGHDHNDGGHSHDHTAEASTQPASSDDHGHAHADGEADHNHDTPETEAFYGEEANAPIAEGAMTSEEDSVQNLSEPHDHGEGEHDHHQ